MNDAASGLQVLAAMGTPPSDWEQDLRRSPKEGGLLQSAYWARVIERVDHASPVFLTVRDGSTLLGQLLLFHKKPFSRRTRSRMGPLAALRTGATTVLEWGDGPVIHDEQRAGETLDALLAWAATYASQNSAKVIRSSGWAATSRWAADADMASRLERHGFRSSGWGTLLVDLSRSEDELFKSLDHAARKCVKRCEREGVRVRRIADYADFLRSYYAPYAAQERASGRETNPPDVAHVMFDEDTDQVYDYFVAEDASGETLATLGMYCFNGVATEVASALLSVAMERKIPAQDLLHWEMLKYAKARGCETFNLAGVSPHPQNAKEAGIRRFKEKWGGQYVEYLRFERATAGTRLWQGVRGKLARLKRRMPAKSPA